MSAALGGAGLYQYRARRFFPGARDRARWLLFQILVWSAFAMQLLNVASVGFHREAGPYVLGLSWVLFLAGWQFYQLIAPTRVR